MYELAADPFGFAEAALDVSEPGTLSPFDAKYPRAKLPDPVAGLYEEAWRRIDSDWLLSASRLALQLDTYTNNTSLVEGGLSGMTSEDLHAATPRTRPGPRAPRTG